MFDMIREWPRYVNVPFPIAKASVYIDGFSVSTTFCSALFICANQLLEHI